MEDNPKNKREMEEKIKEYLKVWEGNCFFKIKITNKDKFRFDEFEDLDDLVIKGFPKSYIIKDDTVDVSYKEIFYALKYRYNNENNKLIIIVPAYRIKNEQALNTAKSINEKRARKIGLEYKI